MESSFVSILNIFSHCHNFNIFARLQDSGIWHQMMVRCKLKHFLSWSSPVTSWKLYIEDQGHFRHIIELCKDTMSNLNPYIVAKHFFFQKYTLGARVLWTAVAGRWHVVVPPECDWAPLVPHVWAQETRNPAGGSVWCSPALLLIAAPMWRVPASVSSVSPPGWKWVKSMRVINTAATITTGNTSAALVTLGTMTDPLQPMCDVLPWYRLCSSVLCRRIIFH